MKDANEKTMDDIIQDYIREFDSIYFKQNRLDRMGAKLVEYEGKLMNIDMFLQAKLDRQ